MTLTPDFTYIFRYSDYGRSSVLENISREMSPNDRLHTTANDQTSLWKTNAQFPTLDRCCTNSATDMNQWARITPPPTI